MCSFLFFGIFVFRIPKSKEHKAIQQGVLYNINVATTPPPHTREYCQKLKQIGKFCVHSSSAFAAGSPHERKFSERRHYCRMSQFFIVAAAKESPLLMSLLIVMRS